MPAKTISQLTQATTINGTDDFAIEQSGVTKRIAASVVRGDIVNANIKSDAAIAFSKLAALNSAQILVGNGSNVPTAVSVTGDVTISNAGVTAIAAGAVVTADLADSAVTTIKVNDAAITPAKLSQPYTLATAQNSTSGKSVDFTGIPSWARRITVMLQGVSTNGTSGLIIQLGTSSTFPVTSGYLGASDSMGSGIAPNNFSSGFHLEDATDSASSVRHYCVTLHNVSGNNWLMSLVGGTSGSTNVVVGAGSISAASLGGALERLRVTTRNGTDDFDAGSINIAYEG